MSPERPPLAETPAAAASWAWLDAGDGRVFRHAGRFRRAARPDAGGVSWYVNDFGLNAAEPWRVPEGESLVLPEGTGQVPRVTWEPAERDEFIRIFDRIMAGIRERRLEKAVPVSTLRGRCEGDAGQWVRRCLGLDGGGAGGHAFGWQEAGSGFGGFSPEILFRLEGRRLTTMALAGTADAAHAGELEAVPKLGREHGVVVEALRQRLESLGRVMTGRREVVAQGSIRHLRTRLTVQLAREPGAEEVEALVRLLHPTPALGCAPRTDDAMRELLAVREATRTPAGFGAPFGAVWPGGAVFVVAIRAVFWDGPSVQVPAGCGLVAGSEASAEWEELELKRTWIRRIFGLD
jgi:menaquinone-specific isochorismate synthase